jgi:hypothetical protein
MTETELVDGIEWATDEITALRAENARLGEVEEAALNLLLG